MDDSARPRQGGRHPRGAPRACRGRHLPSGQSASRRPPSSASVRRGSPGPGPADPETAPARTAPSSSARAASTLSMTSRPRYLRMPRTSRPVERAQVPLDAREYVQAPGGLGILGLQALQVGRVRPGAQGSAQHVACRLRGCVVPALVDPYPPSMPFVLHLQIHVLRLSEEISSAKASSALPAVPREDAVMSSRIPARSRTLRSSHLRRAVSDFGPVMSGKKTPRS